MKRYLRYTAALILLFSSGCASKDLYNSSGRETQQRIRSFAGAKTLTLTMSEDLGDYERISTVTSAADARGILQTLRGLPVSAAASSDNEENAQFVFRTEQDELVFETGSASIKLDARPFAADPADLASVREEVSRQAEETRVRHKQMRFSVKQPPLPVLTVLEEGFVFADDTTELRIIRKTDGMTAENYLSEDISARQEEIEFEYLPVPALLGDSRCIYGNRFSVSSDDGTVTCFLSAAYDADQVMIAVSAVCPEDLQKEAAVYLNSLFSTVVTESMYP